MWLKLTKEQPIEEEVYLGDMPIMLGGGEFIINGAERVVVSQLHRSPGVDYVSELEAGDRRTFSCRIIPEHGSWIELNYEQEGHDQCPHRPERQVLGDDAAAGDGSQIQPERRLDSRVLRYGQRKDRRRPQHRQGSRWRLAAPAKTVEWLRQVGNGHFDGLSSSQVGSTA